MEENRLSQIVYRWLQNSMCELLQLRLVVMISIGILMACPTDWDNSLSSTSKFLNGHGLHETEVKDA